MSRRVAITGGFGFIGSNLVNYWAAKYPKDDILIVDSLTYAAREEYVTSQANHRHIYCDIADAAQVRRFMRMERPEHVIHLAAESHVCRSIEGPRAFVETNIVGTFNLLEAFRHLWHGEHGQKHRFHHVSTDEVYGELPLLDGLHPDDPGRDEKFHESFPYAPRSPYAASKAASDHLVQSYARTYGLNTVITNCSNNFGPNQHPEKLIPKTILSILKKQPITLYGDGQQVRDWIYVVDHCRAIDTVFHEAQGGWQFCVGGKNELSNKDVVDIVASCCVDLGLPASQGVVYTDDRPTDDTRYAIDTTLVETLGWHPDPELFRDQLTDTIGWYAARLSQGLQP